MKIQEYISKAAERMNGSVLCYSHGTDNPHDEAFYIVFGSLEINFSEFENIERQLTTVEISRLDALVQQRIDSRLPAAYIVGKAWFAGHVFHCDDRALVPRSPIAELILGDFQPLISRPPLAVLDLCTGGGCIGIAMALQWPQSKVDLLDVSEEALSLAESNIELHGLQGRVRTIKSDLFDSLTGRYDLIVANPPYVSREEYDDLPAEFTHEPELGLVSAEEGLQIPLQILREAVDYLTDSGLLVMEVGYSHEALAQRLQGVPLLWLEFEHGGDGVLALSAAQLQQYREQFN
jgi:ribosomal protein L3 glutamine methyltransferase